jgi:flavin reductase (DIM6/NTAB) family NADH-FMN oxidoreductase RutF
MQLAAGRIVGSLAVLTAQDEDASAAMLASWISQVRQGLSESSWYAAQQQ